MSINFELTRSFIDSLLTELSFELKRLKCRSKIEIIIVGGSSIILNYNFRQTSFDIDAYYRDDILKQAINNLTDRLDLPNYFLNNDFLNTKSFTPKIIEFSEFYKEYNHVLVVRTITKEYLVAMKLVSFRKYKHDISDIVGILEEDTSITIEMIKKAVVNLYGNYDVLSDLAKSFLDELFLEKNLYTLRKDIKKRESNERNAFINKRKNNT